MSREVPEFFLAAIEEKVAKVNRKAAKLGVEPFKLVVLRRFGKPSEKQSERALGIMYRFVEVELIGPKIEVPGGWQLAGRVDFEGGMTIANSRPGTELPVSFREADGHCDHCNSDRRRNSVFVFELDGQYKQVGKQCLRDYLGHDPERVLWAASAGGGILGEDDDNFGGGGWGDPYISVMEILIASCFVIRLHGFVSKKAAQEASESDMLGKVATSYRVSDYLFDKDERPKFKPLPADLDKAAAVIEMVKGWADRDNLSEYEHNAVLLINSESVLIKRMGLVVSLVAVWNKMNEARVARDALVNKHVGAVGERRGFKAKLLGVNGFPSDFGTFYVARFVSDEGMLVYKGGSPFWPSGTKQGDEIEFVGSIKTHDEYKGMSQTIVARCKLGAMPVKRKKADERSCAAQ